VRRRSAVTPLYTHSVPTHKMHDWHELCILAKRVRCHVSASPSSLSSDAFPPSSARCHPIIPRGGSGLGSVAAIAGNRVHVCAAALGLSAILASSALLFSAVKYAGAAYLCCLGVRVLLSQEADAVIVAPHQQLRRVFAGVRRLHPQSEYAPLLQERTDPAEAAPLDGAYRCVSRMSLASGGAETGLCVWQLA
jgi:hypothetical protein